MNKNYINIYNNLIKLTTNKKLYLKFIIKLKEKQKKIHFQFRSQRHNHIAESPFPA